MSTIDRRVIRTRHALQHAFLRLIVIKGYDQTSIQDICEAANVGRSTFYLHYSSKDELKRAGLDHLRRELLAKCATRAFPNEGAEVPLPFSLAFFEHARAHSGVYRAMVGSSGGSVALATIREILIDLVKADRVLPSEVRTDRTAVSIVVGAYMEVLTAWLDGGILASPAEIDASFRRLVLGGVAPNAVKTYS